MIPRSALYSAGSMAFPFSSALQCFWPIEVLDFAGVRHALTARPSCTLTGWRLVMRQGQREGGHNQMSRFWIFAMQKKTEFKQSGGSRLQTDTKTSQGLVHRCKQQNKERRAATNTNRNGHGRDLKKGRPMGKHNGNQLCGHLNQYTTNTNDPCNSTMLT